MGEEVEGGGEGKLPVEAACYRVRSDKQSGEGDDGDHPFAGFAPADVDAKGAPHEGEGEGGEAEGDAADDFGAAPSNGGGEFGVGGELLLLLVNPGEEEADPKMAVLEVEADAVDELGEARGGHGGQLLIFDEEVVEALPLGGDGGEEVDVAGREEVFGEGEAVDGEEVESFTSSIVEDEGEVFGLLAGLGGAHVDEEVAHLEEAGVVEEVEGVNGGEMGLHPAAEHVGVGGEL